MPDDVKQGGARACGACSMCCKVLPIAELGKSYDQWCAHCRPGNGCTIYETRPLACKSFTCSWLSDQTIGEHWYPAKSKMVVQISGGHDDHYDVFVDVHVDRGASNVWRAEPYVSELQHMSMGKRVLVRVFYGNRTWIVRPDEILEVKVA
jgi:hypothetical protein